MATSRVRGGDLAQNAAEDILAHVHGGPAVDDAEAFVEVVGGLQQSGVLMGC